MRSIRTRVLFLVLGLLAVALSMISYKGYRDARHEVEEVFDSELARTARLLAGMVSRDMMGDARAALQAALDEAVRQPGHKYESKLAFLVLDAQGGVLLRSASAPLVDGHALGAPVDPATGPSGSGPSAATQRLEAGYRDAVLQGVEWRLFLLHDSEDDQWILVGERADVRGELAASIALQSMLPDLVGLPLLALLVWFAVGWGLRPLREMVAMLRARDPENLAPLLLEPLPDELEPVVASLNRLLAQVTELLDREKRFLSYAAHELRTPLAVLRLQAHNAAQAPDLADRDSALKRLDVSVARATRVVEQLLALARLEPGSTVLSMERQNLLGLAREQLAELAPLALARQQELVLDADDSEDFHVVVDRNCLDGLLQNLVGNAVQHTPEKGCIRVCLQGEGDVVELRVQDSGPGVPPALRDRVFERFFRVGPGQGAGLGLSIAARIAQLHRATIGLRGSPLGGLEVYVRFARAPMPAGSAVSAVAAHG